jgi:polysaccharide deacetylase family protein (PEP-CTERM system associated)
MLNALSFDVEDYFQVTGFEQVVDRADWDSIPARFHIGLEKILDILERYRVEATFFFLGWIAERHPGAVREVAERGHEIGIHGYDHRLIYQQTPQAFEADLRRALAAVRRCYDGPVLGHRAPSFSIREDSLWALEVLERVGFRYDSSIFPFKRRRYGIAGAPVNPYKVREALWEFPMSTVRLMGKALPVGGGGYLRLYPYAVTRKAIEAMNAEGRPAMVYVHPWELDPEQPVVRADFGNRFRHRVNLKRTQSRLEALCRSFRFGPVREVLGL